MSKKPIPDTVSELDIKQTCGIIMPISASSGYTKEHWSEVKAIISDVIDEIGYYPKLVSDADDVGIIHNRIVTNIAENPIVICDVSSKNPNVMFELGLRLAFDKPTIIIKDEQTTYSFDTGVIEHLDYQSSLHYPSIIEFKAKLKAKLLATLDASKAADYSTFLKNFVVYKTEVKTQELQSSDFIIKQLEIINLRLDKLSTNRNPTPNTNKKPSGDTVSFDASYIAGTVEGFFSSSERTFKAFKTKTEGNNFLQLLDFLRKVFPHDIEKRYLFDLATMLSDLIDESNTLVRLIKTIKSEDWTFSVTS